MNPFLAELRKLRTVRTTWVLTLMGFGLTVLSASALLFSALTGSPFSGADEQISFVIAAIGSTAMFVLIVGLLAMTTEFRHKTIGRTLQITPSRMRMIGAKFALGITYALGYFLTALLLVGALILIAAGTADASLDIGGETLRALWQTPVALVLNAMLGVALGALIRSQAVAITATLVWLFVVENLVAALRPNIGKWLPFQALDSLFVPADIADAGVDAGFALLSPAVALAVFLGYVVAIAVAAVVLLRTRDV